jgi:pSer/pThr/pTyr-binding forkhead associated (FHA) protein
MASSVADYKKDLDHLGTNDFLRLYPWPVLVVNSVAGVLKGLAARGTVITELPDLSSVPTRPGRVFLVAKGRHSEPGPITIGRTSENDVVVNEYSVSTRHAILAVVNGEYRLTDMGATNGTLVNGVRMVPRKPCRLQGGETLQLGRITLLFLFASQFAEHLARGTLSAP